MKEEQVFHQALEQPIPQRPALLAAACGDDPALRERVEALWRAHETPGSFLRGAAGPPCSATIDERASTEAPGTVIGPYKLLEQIGEGGFGIVYMAEQST